jgi:hypothetical protein
VLGEELGKRTPAQLASGPNTFFQRYFSETGHSVIYAFLSFFDRNGGVETFGYPIAEYGAENGKGRIGQYFQRAKLEWYPELAPEQRVQLADLGSIHFDLLAEQGKVDPALKKPVAAPGTIGDVPLALKVSATTKYTITARRGNQTLYVYVTDQKDMPVKDAECHSHCATHPAHRPTAWLPRTRMGLRRTSLIPVVSDRHRPYSLLSTPDRAASPEPIGRLSSPGSKAV